MSTNAEPVIIAVYVDDILIAGRTDERIAEVKVAIAIRFDIKDNGNLHYFLEVKVIQDLEAGSIWIGQPAYTENLVLHFNMQDAKPVKLLLILV